MLVLTINFTIENSNRICRFDTSYTDNNDACFLGHPVYNSACY